MPTLNLGILAHVDAGKTSLTERLLFDTGTIARLGSVDTGDTQTDRGELERARGITIRSAVASFRLGDLRVNLIDTPGHADFAAEVERALGVLDGAVLVLSAIEMVQARTRVLMRALHALALPTLIFVNKTDRPGADPDAVLAAISRRLPARPVPLNRLRSGHLVSCEPSPEILADGDDALLADYIDGRETPPQTLWASLRRQTAAGAVQPLYFGSAMTGGGVPDLLNGIGTLLPPAAAGDGETRGSVFAVERTRSGERVAYLRLFSGELRLREDVTFATGHGGRITGLEVIGAPGSTLTAGDIARVRGLSQARVGDRIGPPVRDVPPFPPPSLETIVRTRRPADAGRLRAALLDLADEDPLIRARPAPSGATSVLLYGEVHKEVIAARLLTEAGIEAVFEETRTLYTERPAGIGEAAEDMNWRRRMPDFWATIGLRVEPAPHGSGNTFRRDTEQGALPHAFDRAIEETVHDTLEQGLHGWPVTDCAVVLTHSGFAGPISTAADFRGLTPLILMEALTQAGARVYEPTSTFEAESPADTLSAVLSALAALGATLEPSPGPDGWTIKGEIPAARAREAETALPALTRGEGTWWSGPSGERPVTGTPPTRPRTGADPRNRPAYLRHLARGQ
ncbi:TetM/TetW/TetO/TetS family tetracycline resistance ribosomal protection protein [Actinomadura barringtoniae]|uniref:TetM/TetW/TetO/TetS family tetracycline resistance ribosomal protection protein n=1 Tax=Actinomadura barringtoniae TaxID=1427535 RepID=A0A939PBW7_9ACTN|nr:TetM/TetW/TetO/TetS family tetracycline resistance ribosomal protection protein [Actinomadura barringtoniae]MBO2449790.1 TetM/TetW/TetO/TetS family tetracycline resistance ribosomal protection protein [Actinomadura barringtoniae]